MIVLNEGTDTEVTLRVVLTSELGNEYFDSYDSLDEALAAVKRIVESSIEQGDGIERLIGIAVVPKSGYGSDDGYGYDLTKEFTVTDKDGFAFFEDNGDNDACNDFMDETNLGIDDDGFVLLDDERMTYADYLNYDALEM